MVLPGCWAKVASLISYSQARAMRQIKSQATYDAGDGLEI